MALSSAKIIRKIGCDKLELAKGEGYWYFIYDDKAGKYDTCSIMEMYLGQDKHLNFWVEAGKEFVEKMEK
jgi:hypothetical protein